MTRARATGWAAALAALMDLSTASGRHRRAKTLRFLHRHGTPAQRRALLEIQRLRVRMAERRFWAMRAAPEPVDPKFLNRGARERRHPNRGGTMSEGLMCLKCRRYIYAADLLQVREHSKWDCACTDPIPSEDGVTVSPLPHTRRTE